MQRQKKIANSLTNNTLHNVRSFEILSPSPLQSATPSEAVKNKRPDGLLEETRYILPLVK